MKKCEEELALYGDGVPIDEGGKLSLLWNMLNEFCEMYKNVLQGKFDNKRLDFLEDEGGYKIKEHFKTLLENYTGDYRATGSYTDDYINYALTIHEGDSIPGFPSVDAFFFLLKPLLEVLKEPINECFQNIYSYLELIAEKVMERSFQRFPRLIKDLGELIKGFLTQERDKTKYIIDSILDMEINSLFTNDYDYMTNYTSFVPKQDQDNKKPGLPQPVDSRSIFIKEIRNRIEAYFKLIVRNLRAAIPKTIGYNLVKNVEENMQIDLYNKLYNNKEIVHSLDEPEHIMIRRQELTRQIKVLRDAQKVIRRDPDLMSSMSISISENDIIGMPTHKEEPAPVHHEPEPVQNQPQPVQNQPHPVQNQAPHTEPNKQANMGNIFGGKK